MDINNDRASKLSSRPSEWMCMHSEYAGMGGGCGGWLYVPAHVLMRVVGDQAAVVRVLGLAHLQSPEPFWLCMHT